MPRVRARNGRPFRFRIRGRELPPAVEGTVVRTIYSTSLGAGQQVRGHYHPRRTEVIVVMEGSVTLTVRTTAGTTVLRGRLVGGKEGAYIPPGFVHAVRCGRSKGAVLLILASHRNDRKVLAP